MFRCTECQTEYEIKPDFCDCGNDTFEEINPKKEEVNPEPKPIPKQEIKTVQQEIPQTEYVKPQKTKKKNDFFEPFSTIFFAVCVILSFVIIFFVGNPKDNDVEIVKTEDNATVAKNIPNINSFWNNTPPKPEPKTISHSQQQQVEQPVVQQQPIQPVPVQVHQSQPKIVVQQNYQPPKQQILNKPQPIQQTKPQTQVKPKQQTQTVQQPVQQPTQPKAQPAATQQTTVTKPQTVTPTVNKQELANYKINLRNKLAGKMNFANVIGDGTCIISFNISSNGTLTNRKFAQQSDNFTLNDVVYNAVMQTPSYNPPPSAYKSETMRLTVKMYHGNFEVSLK